MLPTLNTKKTAMGYRLGTEHQRYKITCAATKAHADLPPMRRVRGCAISSNQEWFGDVMRVKVEPVFYKFSRQGCVGARTSRS